MSMINRPLWTLAVMGTMGLLPAQEQGQAPPAPSPISSLIEQLGDRSYQVRKSAEEALRQRGTEAVDALRRATTEQKDSEVQWRAQRLLRQIESGDDGKLRPGAAAPAQPPAGRPGLRRPGKGQEELEGAFDDMFERLERDLGMVVPRGRFFADDFFKDLQQQMRGGTSWNMVSPGESFSFRIGEDGVKLEISERGEDGKAETKVYEAPDEQTFREKYPEIAQRYLSGRGPGFGGSFGMAFPGMPRLRVFDGRGLQPVDPFRAPPQAPEFDPALDAGDRLGVMVEPLPDEVRDFLGLEADTGLRVQSCVEGSLGATLGLRQGDVLLEVAGKSIGSPEQVREALSGVEAGAKVEVKINRRGAEQVLSAPKPGNKAAGRKLEPRDAAKPELKKAEIR
jgi:hypothetical protein